MSHRILTTLRQSPTIQVEVLRIGKYVQSQSRIVTKRRAVTLTMRKGMSYRLFLILFPTSLSRPLELSKEHVDMLQKRVAEYRTSSMSRCLAIVKNCLNTIQEQWDPNDKFNRKKVETVRTLSIIFGLAYLTDF